MMQDPVGADSCNRGGGGCCAAGTALRRLPGIAPSVSSTRTPHAPICRLPDDVCTADHVLWNDVQAPVHGSAGCRCVAAPAAGARGAHSPAPRAPRQRMPCLGRLRIAAPPAPATRQGPALSARHRTRGNRGARTHPHAQWPYRAPPAVIMGDIGSEAAGPVGRRVVYAIIYTLDATRCIILHLAGAHAALDAQHILLCHGSGGSSGASTPFALGAAAAAWPGMHHEPPRLPPASHHLTSLAARLPRSYPEPGPCVCRGRRTPPVAVRAHRGRASTHPGAGVWVQPACQQLLQAPPYPPSGMPC